MHFLNKVPNPPEFVLLPAFLSRNRNRRSHALSLTRTYTGRRREHRSEDQSISGTSEEQAVNKFVLSQREAVLLNRLLIRTRLSCCLSLPFVRIHLFRWQATQKRKAAKGSERKDGKVVARTLSLSVAQLHEQETP